MRVITMGERKPRGEIAELGASLQNLCSQGKRSPKELLLAKKEVFKKVINYMTLGMDMSPLFPMMTSCANLSADDIVLKKLLYLYLTHYASQTPDLALLTINQLQKDCRDQDPTVRGLALRTLCSLRVPNFLEYVVSPINTGLEDRHPYVRRTAVMGVVKVYHIDKAIVVNTGMLEKLRRMLYYDLDPQVVSNCLYIIMQVDDIKKLADKVLVYNLINKIKEFSDWSQCQVLELASHYVPANEEEVFDVLNALEDRMSHVNSAIVMATIKVFLLHTLNMTATHQQVLERIKEPLKTLISREDPSSVYAVLCHLNLIVQRASFIFEQEYVSFYCRTHDPWYVKKLKMEILTAIASTSNVYEIVSELSEYARDINPSMAREAIKSIGRVALLVPDSTGILERLLNFLESGSEHIMAETLIQMKDLLRRYPDLADVCIATVNEINPNAITEPAARAALFWIMGQFGQYMQDAPYQFEGFAESFSTEPTEVRLALLTAAAQLFFKRPPEAQKMLGMMLVAGLNDTQQEVHDRALLYYRLLRQSVTDAERVISPPMVAVQWFSETMTSEVKDKIFSEFNSLSVIFMMPSSSFVEPKAYHSEEEVEANHTGMHAPDEPAADGVDNATGLLDLDAQEGDLLDFESQASSEPSSFGGLGGVPLSAGLPVSGVSTMPNDAMYDLDDLLGGLGGGPPQQQAAADGGGGAVEMVLAPQAKLPPAVFQDHWRTFPVAHQYTDTINQETVAALASNGHKEFSQHMMQGYINTMASGGQPPQFKYYFFATTADGSGEFLVEMIVATSSGQTSVTVKSNVPQLVNQFVELWVNLLVGFYR